jgi:phosphomannomutase
MHDHTLSPDIIKGFFKSYDMRGTVPTLNSEIFYWTGLGLASEIIIPQNLPKLVNVMHDCRLSSNEFYSAFVQGVIDGGCEVNALGFGSTDLLYGSTLVTHNTGAMITASHNPKDDNGVKILKIGSTMLGLEEGLGTVRDFVVTKYNSDPELHDRLHALTTPELNVDLKNQVEEFFVNTVKNIGETTEVDSILQSRGKKLKIAVDAGNGMGGYVMELVKNIYSNIEFVPLYWELDGNYPNHPADPQNFDNLKDLQNLIRTSDIDFGFALDGDSDRIFFVDDHGDVINGDFLVAFFSKTILKANAKKPSPDYNHAIVYLQPGSRCVIEAINESDGVAIPSMQGHTKIKEQMQKYKALYGGEFSGHHYFAQFGYLDSAILAGVLMIKILTEQNQKISEVFAKLKKEYFISDLVNFTIPTGMNFTDIITKVKAGFPDAAFSQMDGISVFYPDWKFSMRPSNTEPKVRFILETRGIDKVAEKLELVKSMVGY